MWNLDKSKCLRCEMCVRTCPVKALTMQDFPVNDWNKCVKCRACEHNCPVCAISIEVDEDE